MAEPEAECSTIAQAPETQSVQVVSNILRPTLQDNDFLQSFVRIDLDDALETRRTTFADEITKRKEPVVSSPRSKQLGHHDAQEPESRRRVASPSPSPRSREPSSRVGRSTIGGGGGGAGGGVVGHKVQDLLREEMKLKKSRRHRRRKSDAHRQEEVYTDKDRAAAVNMGSRDIKQSLKLKRRQDRSRALQIPEEAEPGAILALGMRELKCGNVKVAASCMNKALELSPNDRNALIARSKCHLLLGEPQKALDDAEAALRGRAKDPHNARALFSKAEALYHLGDFELSLVYYYRGMKIRPEFDQFRLGVQKAKEAIQNILGGNSVPVPIKSVSRNESSSLANQSPNDSASTLPKTCSPTTVVGSERFENKSLSNSSVSRQTPSKGRSFSIRRKKARPVVRPNNQEMQLLEQLNVDKRYLQNLLKRSDVKAAHQESAQHITVHAEEGVNFLKSRQEFWKQQRTNRYTRACKK